MQFKPSAGIFVAGLVMSIVGSAFGFIGVSILSRSYYGDGAGGGWLTFLGFLTAVIGTVMVYVGATRALRIIDALPTALGFQGQGQAPHVPAPQAPVQQFQQPVPPQPQQQPYMPPQTPQHLVYNDNRQDQQPPIQ